MKIRLYKKNYFATKPSWIINYVSMEKIFIVSDTVFALIISRMDL